MLKQITVGKALQELQDKIKEAYHNEGYRARITGVVVELSGENVLTREVVLTPNAKKQPIETVWRVDAGCSGGKGNTPKT
jgi:hypothetical protein